MHELRVQVEEEEYSLNLLLAYIDVLKKKKNNPYKPSTNNKSSSSTTINSSFQMINQECKTNPTFPVPSPSSQPQQNPDSQPPWFRLVKRRRVSDEYSFSTNLSFKTGSEILIEKEQEWTEFAYSQT